jgi:hypothetical protein
MLLAWKLPQPELEQQDLESMIPIDILSSHESPAETVHNESQTTKSCSNSVLSLRAVLAWTPNVLLMTLVWLAVLFNASECFFNPTNQSRFHSFTIFGTLKLVWILHYKKFFSPKTFVFE